MPGDLAADSGRSSVFLLSNRHRCELDSATRTRRCGAAFSERSVSTDHPLLISKRRPVDWRVVRVAAVAFSDQSKIV